MTSARMSKLFPGKMKPAASTRSVGGINACATSKCVLSESVRPSGAGNMNPRLLSKGSKDSDANREFHIRFGKNAVFAAIGVRRWFRGPVRPGPTIKLFSMQRPINWIEANPHLANEPHEQD